MADVPIPPKKAGPLCPGTGESSDTGRSSWPPAPDAPKHEEGIPGDESNVVNTRQHYKSRRGSQPDQEELPVSHLQFLFTPALFRKIHTDAQGPNIPYPPRLPSHSITPSPFTPDGNITYPPHLPPIS
jgi:hypothetical protein